MDGVALGGLGQSHLIVTAVEAVAAAGEPVGPGDEGRPVGPVAHSGGVVGVEDGATGLRVLPDPAPDLDDGRLLVTVGDAVLLAGWESLHVAAAC